MGEQAVVEGMVDTVHMEGVAIVISSSLGLVDIMYMAMIVG